jgi:hypothetical protein
MVDCAKCNTVEAVEAYVLSLPLSVRKVMDVPWNGRRLDVQLVQENIDSFQSNAANTVATAITAPATTSVSTPATTTTATTTTALTAPATTAVSTPATTTTTAPATTTTTAPATTAATVATVDDCHVLIPHANMVDWITSSMSCRHCRAAIKATCISKTTAGIATQLHCTCDSEKCLRRKKNTMEAETVDVDSEDKRVLRSSSRHG